MGHSWAIQIGPGVTKKEPRRGGLLAAREGARKGQHACWRRSPGGTARSPAERELGSDNSLLVEELRRGGPLTGRGSPIGVVRSPVKEGWARARSARAEDDGGVRERERCGRRGGLDAFPANMEVVASILF
jgi:hypothetical protein